LFYFYENRPVAPVSELSHSHSDCVRSDQTVSSLCFAQSASSPCLV